MRTVRKNVVLASLAAAGLLLSAPVALSAVPGQGWDAFNSGQGEAIMVIPYTGTAMDSEAGLGFDAFRSGDGVQIEVYEQAYMGTSLGSQASDGWDVFRSGEGDPLP